MGKNTRTAKYGPVLVQLLLIAGALVTPFLAFNLIDLELFSVSKTTFTTLFSSIKPWLCPPYVYLVINFIIILIIAASSSIISYNPIPTTETDDDSFIRFQSSLAVGLSSDGDAKFDRTVKDPDGDEGRSKEVVVSESVRELRKSKTFGVSESRARGRKERYVRILSQEELDRQVEAFIYRCKQDTNFQKSE